MSLVQNSTNIPECESKVIGENSCEISSLKVSNNLPLGSETISSNFWPNGYQIYSNCIWCGGHSNLVRTRFERVTPCGIYLDRCLLLSFEDDWLHVKEEHFSVDNIRKYFARSSPFSAQDADGWRPREHVAVWFGEDDEEFHNLI